MIRNDTIRWSQTYGDFGVIGTYTADGDPVMGVYKKTNPNRALYCIDLNAAYQFAESQSGDPTPELLKRADGIAEFIGFRPDTLIRSRLCDAIVSCIPNLVKMPPLSQSVEDEIKQVVAEGKVKAGDTEVEFEIKDHGCN